MARGADTRERIMDIAESAILEKGFGATSIEEIIAEAGLTKGGFFYHFPDKGALAKALLLRYRDTEDAIFDDLFARASELHDDPLHAFLIGLKLFAELMEELETTHPGCLMATYTYAERLFDKDVHELNREIVLSWRHRFRAAIEDIVAIYPPRDRVDLDALADMVGSAVEGGIVMSRALKDPAVLPQQVMLLRSYFKLLFSPQIN